MFSTFFKSSLTLSIGFIFSAIKSFAGDAIVVATSFYHIDNKHKIIVINQKVADINIDATTTKNYLTLDKTYTFVVPTVSVSTTTSYEVKLQNITYTAYFTELPVVHVDTRNEIVDSPSVYAKFWMSETAGTITKSNLGIEIRGGWSQTYPKKSYELGFWDDTTGKVNRDISLLKMRNDNKWNLQAIYNEPLRSSSKVSNELWQDIHQVYYKDREPDAKNGINMAYVELFLNNEYKGIYNLTERVDRKQLKLKKYNNGIIGELYKGSDWGGAVTFTGLPAFTNTSSEWGGFEYKHPEEQTDWSNLYSFVDFVKNSTDQEFYSKYQSKFNLKNAVDYYIFLNLLRASDNVGKNLYIAKYKTGEPYYYVPWDLDGVFGNNWYGAKDNTTDDILSNGFYKRLIKDNSAAGFNDMLTQRWNELRSTIITEDYILNKFKTNQDYLISNNVYQREESVWSDFTYDAAYADYTAMWLKKRIVYLDKVFGQPISVLKATSTKPKAPISIYPNPADNQFFIQSNGLPYHVAIKDMSGKTVFTCTINGTISTISTEHLQRGLYIVTVENDKAFKTEKLVIN